MNILKTKPVGDEDKEERHMGDPHGKQTIGHGRSTLSEATTK